MSRRLRDHGEVGLVRDRVEVDAVGLGLAMMFFSACSLGTYCARLARHPQAGIVGRLLQLLVLLDGARHRVLAPVVGGEGEVPVAVHLVDVRQVVERGVGRGDDVAPAVVPPVLLQLVALAGAGDELPEAGSMRARVGHRVERALDHRQQRQLGRQAALLELVDDVVQIELAALEDALQVVLVRSRTRPCAASPAALSRFGMEKPCRMRCHRSPAGAVRSMCAGSAARRPPPARRRTAAAWSRRAGRAPPALAAPAGRIAGSPPRAAAAPARLAVRRRRAPAPAPPRAPAPKRRPAAARPRPRRRDLACSVQERFFQSRIAANTLHRIGHARSEVLVGRLDHRRLEAAQERVGGLLFAECARAASACRRRASVRSRASRASSAALPGSTACAKPMLASVYSWPQ